MERKKDVISLRLPVDAAYIPTARSFVQEVAEKAGLSEGDADKIVLAANEAVANVIKHASLPEDDAFFDLICEVSSLVLKVIVRDKGYPFSPEKVAQYSIEKVLKDGDAAGLGFYLMKHSVDKLSFHNNGFGGKEVHLVKYIHQDHIEGRIDKLALKIYETTAQQEKKPIEKINYRVELLDIAKSIEVSQCAYRTYGYNYIHEFIYYPERIAEMNSRKELISAVAINEKTAEIISHAALELSDGKDIVELGAAFTKPECRNQGCFNRICEYLLDVAKTEGIKGIYATAVTIHPFSQKAILKNGFRECGILLGMGHASMFKDPLEHGQQRESTVMLFRNVDQSLNKSLYAPQRHKAILEEIYANINVPIKWQKAKVSKRKVFPCEYSIIETRVKSSMANASIYVNKYGADILKKIQRNLKELDRSKIEAVYLYLDLSDPLTAALARDFEEMGFFFSGVLPSGSRQNLVLQYLNDIRIDYGKICVASDFMKKLLFYVKALDPNQQAERLKNSPII